MEILTAVWVVVICWLSLLLMAPDCFSFSRSLCSDVQTGSVSSSIDSLPIPLLCNGSSNIPPTRTCTLKSHRHIQCSLSLSLSKCGRSFRVCALPLTGFYLFLLLTCLDTHFSLANSVFLCVSYWKKIFWDKRICLNLNGKFYENWQWRTDGTNIQTNTGQDKRVLQVFTEQFVNSIETTHWLVFTFSEFVHKVLDGIKNKLLSLIYLHLICLFS